MIRADIISPSRLAVESLGMDLEGSLRAEEELHCAVCGGPIHAGEPMGSMDLPPSFTNQSDLASNGGRYRCGACVAVMTKVDFQRSLASGLFNKHGFFPINKKEHRAWAFIEGIEPPYVMTIQVSKSQHTIWRSPVSLSSELIMAGVGDTKVRVRKSKLLAARDLAVRLNQLRKPSAGRPAKALENPFVNEWKMKSCQAGRLKHWAVELLSTDGFTSDEVGRLESLTAGEVWALTAALGAPVKPESISI